MRSGSLNKKVTIQREATGSSSDGWGPQTSWVDVHRVWASVVAKAGTETFGDKVTQSQTTFTIKTRFVADVNSRDRVLLRDGRVLNIVSAIDPTGRRRELEITATEHSAVDQPPQEAA